MKPNVIAAGHGIPMQGERMQDELSELAACVEIAAQQAVRWYANQPAHSRVVAPTYSTAKK